jgi:hypothetical protein
VGAVDFEPRMRVKPVQCGQEKLLHPLLKGHVTSELWAVAARASAAGNSDAMEIVMKIVEKTTPLTSRM